MAIIVVGGNGRNVGKTTLVCGLISALPEFSWIAVKIRDHAHGDLPAIYEQKAAAEPKRAKTEADTSRYLAAGAQRAFLVTAEDASLAERLTKLWDLVGSSTNVIFESNRILREVQPDLCIAIAEPDAERKSSFVLLEQRKHVTVQRSRSESDGESPGCDGAQPLFHLPNFGEISPAMEQWVREHLPARVAG
jgi:hypothetical protein